MAVELTAREEDVARCIRWCLSNKEIERQLGMSRSSVIRHLSNIYRKVGISWEGRDGGRLKLYSWLIAREAMAEAVHDAQEHYVGAR